MPQEEAGCLKTGHFLGSRASEYHPSVSDTPRERRPLTPGRLIAFSLFTLLLFVVLLEVVLQILAATQGPQHRLPADGSIEPPDSSAFRVVAVGDSWIYGAESEPDEAFIEVFRRAAAEQLGKPVQVYNLGVSASNSAQALVSLAGVIDPVQPDLVVALTGANNGLHDRGVMEAARILGEDARTVSGLSALSGLRTVRLARLIWVNLLAPDQIEATAADASLPTPDAPEPRASTVTRFPWWDLFVARRWDDALIVLRDTTPPEDTPAVRGIQKAWEALLLAHTGDLVGAEKSAIEALRVGGDDVTAHAARALIEERQGRGLRAMHHRARAAQAPGNPALRERARGRVLLEVEAWEPARSWLLSVARAVPGNLETLMALAQLPGTVRTEEVDALLFDGPKGVVTPREYMEWHLASSGMIDRAVASLGDVDPNEPYDLRLARAAAAALQGDSAGALAAYETLVGEAQDDRQRDEALGGALRHGGSPQELLGGAPAGPRAAIGALVAHEREGDCVASVLAAQQAMDLGAAPQDVEKAAGACVPRDRSWTLREMVFERERPIDRHVLIRGDERIGTLPAPRVPFWSTFRARRFEEIPSDAPPEWRALARAFDDAVDDPLLAEIRDGMAVADPAVGALAVGYAHLRSGKTRLALVHLARAAESTEGEPWARVLARGLGSAAAGDWSDAQHHLHLAETAAFRQLESLDALSRVPPRFRSRDTREASVLAPVGRVRGPRWVEWYLDRSQLPRAELALRWSWATDGPLGDLRMKIERADILERQGSRIDAVALLQSTIAELESSHPEESELLCRAVVLRKGFEFEPGEPRALLPRCRDSREPSEEGLPPLAKRWLALHEDPNSAQGTKGPTARTDVLVRQLEGMRRLSESQGAAFVALTYPFPSGHHAEVRDVVTAGGEELSFDVLDLYGAFEATYSQPEWEGMRTPEDHVNAAGYEEMGRRLVDWATTSGLLSPAP